jgi:hypothetical protein
MIEMHLLRLQKETENKVRWDAEADDVTFELYIPKWRVPKPWPLKIYVKIDIVPTKQNNFERVTFEMAKENHKLVSQHIVADVMLKEEHTKTIRYCPDGNNEDWEIGEPYIPFALTHNNAERLRIVVDWVLP